jgi:hypothetical protein
MFVTGLSNERFSLSVRSNDTGVNTAKRLLANYVRLGSKSGSTKINT